MIGIKITMIFFACCAIATYVWFVIELVKLFREDNMSECPDCDSTDIKKETKREVVVYGLFNTVIYVWVPVYTCQKCKYAWTDGEAELLRQQAVESHKQEI